MNKDWTGNSKSVHTILGASNHSIEERAENDYYATPPQAVEELLKRESFNQYVWEPACGAGHISDVLKQAGYQVYSTDIVNRNNYADDIADFLAVGVHEFESWKGDIITNPPYKYCCEFIKKSLEVIKNGNKVAMFLKLQTLESEKRYLQVFKDNPPKTIYVFVKRVGCLKNGIETGESSAVCYAWFVWEKGFDGDPIIKWIY